MTKVFVFPIINLLYLLLGDGCILPLCCFCLSDFCYHNTEHRELDMKVCAPHYNDVTETNRV